MGAKGSGRRPTPQAIKLLRGTARPGHRGSTPGATGDAPIRCPSGVSKDVRRIFNRLAKDLAEMRLVKPVDVHLLVQLATAIDLTQQAAREIADGGAVREDAAHNGRLAKSPWFQIWRDAAATVRSLSAHFGLSPADRERLSIPDEHLPTVNELLDELAAGREFVRD